MTNVSSFKGTTTATVARAIAPSANSAAQPKAPNTTASAPAALSEKKLFELALNKAVMPFNALLPGLTLAFPAPAGLTTLVQQQRRSNDVATRGGTNTFFAYYYQNYPPMKKAVDDMLALLAPDSQETIDVGGTPYSLAGKSPKLYQQMLSIATMDPLVFS